MKSLLIVLGNQLFDKNNHPKEISHIFMCEDFDLCTYEKHHKKKISFFLTSMREYRDEMSNSGYVLQSDGFTRYVRRKTPKIILQRDHGGPKQGARDDDGIESLVEDCRNKFELIHIDPWKKFKDIDAAASSTTHLISTALEANKSCLFEVGTEEAIRKYSPLELEYFLNKLKNDLGEKFNSIKFAVIQSGVGLMGVSNIGNFDEQRCKDMISV